MKSPPIKRNASAGTEASVETKLQASAKDSTAPRDRAFADRIPQHSIEAEQSLLGALLLDNSVTAKVTETVTAPDFYSDAHRIIFEHIIARTREGEPADAPLVGAAIEAAGKLDYCGGMTYLGQLVANVPTGANAVHYAKVIKERSRLRAIGAFANTMNAATMTPGAESGVMLAEARAKLDALAATATQDEELDASDLLNMEFKPMTAVIPNIIVNGVTINAAKPKIGKTWFGAALTLANATEGELLRHSLTPGASLLIALEDNDRRLNLRLRKLARVLGSPKPGTLRIRHEWPRGPEGAAKLDDYLTANPSVNVVVIDTYRGIAPKRGRGSDLVSEDYATIAAYKAVTDRHGIALVIVMHLRKGGDEGDWIDSISGTHGLTAAADALLVLKRARGEDLATLSITGRDIEHDNELGLRFDREHALWCLGGSAAEIQASEERREVLTALRINAAPMTQREIATTVERTNGRRRSAAALSQLVAGMVRDGLIVPAAGSGYTLPQG